MLCLKNKHQADAISARFCLTFGSPVSSAVIPHLFVALFFSVKNIGNVPASQEKSPQSRSAFHWGTVPRPEFRNSLWVHATVHRLFSYLLLAIGLKPFIQEVEHTDIFTAKLSSTGC